MSGERIRQVTDAIASHPKTSTVIAGATNLNVWFANYEPILKLTTSLLGIVLVSVLIVKHTIDIKKSLSEPAYNDPNESQNPKNAEK